MFLREELKRLIKERLSVAINDENMPLPKDLESNKLYKTDYYKYGNRGYRELRFIIELNDTGKVSIDYFFKTDDYSSHRRIDVFGNIVDLENYEGQFGWPIFDSKEETEKEHNRIREHNQFVYDILKLKKFED